MEFPKDDAPPDPPIDDDYNLSEVDELLKEEELFTPYDMEPIPYLGEEEPEVSEALFESVFDVFLGG